MTNEDKYRVNQQMVSRTEEHKDDEGKDEPKDEPKKDEPKKEETEKPVVEGEETHDHAAQGSSIVELRFSRAVDYKTMSPTARRRHRIH